jgi:hypothetical protein
MGKKKKDAFNNEDSLAVELLFEAIAKTQGMNDLFAPNQDPNSPQQKLKEKYLQQLVKL